jgi:hypothetical protein
MYLKEALNSIERGQSILSQLLDFSNVLTSTRDSITQQLWARVLSLTHFNSIDSKNLYTNLTVAEDCEIHTPHWRRSRENTNHQSNREPLI